jgi:acetyl-CoA synthetase
VLVTSEFAKQDPRQLEGALKDQVRHVIGAFAQPEVVHVAPGLPKTRSGKIMRRILRKIAAGEYDGMGDVTTLAEPEVVEKLIAHIASGLGEGVDHRPNSEIETCTAVHDDLAGGAGRIAACGRGETKPSRLNRLDPGAIAKDRTDTVRAKTADLTRRR